VLTITTVTAKGVRDVRPAHRAWHFGRRRALANDPEPCEQPDADGKANDATERADVEQRPMAMPPSRSGPASMITSAARSDQPASAQRRPERRPSRPNGWRDKVLEGGASFVAL
jgi:hypothetical protein